VKNIPLGSSTKAEIDKLVERVLKGLGNPMPPLRLEDVRDLLKLDRQFYTAASPGKIQESVSRIRVATIQVFKRPMLLIDAIRKLNLKALYLPDHKRILLDGDLPEKKHRWNESHEIGHSLLPWHENLMHGDDDYTLSTQCHEQIEAEANYAAGRLLFFQDRFTEQALSLPISLKSVRELKNIFGNTLTTTLYHYVERSCADIPMVGLITCHPHSRFRPVDLDTENPCRHMILSPAFREAFSAISNKELFEVIRSYCGPRSGGPLGTSEQILTDDNGDEHRFLFETFFNTHDALTLAIYLGKEPTRVAATGQQ
jgi:Zn-dependent peptidase ImmA (M78 family)